MLRFLLKYRISTLTILDIIVTLIVGVLSYSWSWYISFLVGIVTGGLLYIVKEWFKKVYNGGKDF